MHILDKFEEGRGVEWRGTWAWELSFTQHMPLVQVLVVLVGDESMGDGLGYEGVNQHCHGLCLHGSSLGSPI